MLASCGGGSDSILPRGSLATNPPRVIAQVSSTDLATVAADVTAVTGAPICGVKVHYLQYGTVGGAGEAGDAADLSPSRPSAFARAIASSLTADVESVLSETLGARESGVLRMRYGLDDGRPKTLEEIGAAYSVTRERIRQIEAKALLKLRAQPERCSTLSDYADDGDGDDIFGAQWKSATTKARS